MRRPVTEGRFLLVNRDKKEFVSPRSIGLEPQQRFHLGFDGSLSDALYVLTCADWGGTGDLPNVGEACGRWAGDNVSIVSNRSGDYRLVANTYISVGNLVREAFTKLFDIEYEEIISGTLSIGWKRKDLF